MQRTSSILLAAASVLAFGCSAPVDMPETNSEPDVASQTFPIEVACNAGPAGATCVEYTSSSGLLTVRVKTCPAPPAAKGEQILLCPGESGYSVIGGGGNVIGLPSPSALMTKSAFPLNGPSGAWEVRFKTHLSSGSYRAQAYSINLKVNTWSAATLENALLFVNKYSDGNAPAPGSTATLPAGYTLIGGGGSVQTENLDGAGILLERSEPTDRGWFVKGAYHLAFDTGTANAQAVGIRTINPDIIFSSTQYSVQGPEVSTGFASSAVTTNPSAVLSAIGGVSIATGQSADDIQRFLTHVIPSANGAQGAFVRARDRSRAVSGYVVAKAVSLGAIKTGIIR